MDGKVDALTVDNLDEPQALAAAEPERDGGGGGQDLVNVRTGARGRQPPSRRTRSCPALFDRHRHGVVHRKFGKPAERGCTDPVQHPANDCELMIGQPQRDLHGRQG